MTVSEMTLEELEERADIAHHQEMQAVIDRYAALREIYERDLWVDKAPTWAVYLLERHHMKQSYWDNMRANVRAAKRALEQFGVTLGNKQAAREFRTLFHRWADTDLLPLVVQKARQVAGEGNPLQGKHLRAVMNVTLEVVRTGGKVSVNGESLAYNAALDEETAEACQRQKAHAANGAQRSPWSTPMAARVLPRPFDALHDLNETLLLVRVPRGVTLPVGANIEVKVKGLK